MKPFVTSALLLFCFLPGRSQAQAPEFYFDGASDVRLRFPPRGSGGRALVHDDGNILGLNYAGDFSGGTRIGTGFFIYNNGNLIATRLDAGANTWGSKSNLVVMRLRNNISENQYSGWGSALEFYSNSNNQESHPNQNEGGAKIISEASEYGWAQNLKFRVVNNNNYQSQQGIDAMTIHTNGNIGIGTNSPDARLSVKGLIHAQEVKVDLNGAVAPDFVFENMYKLKTLEETEQFIKENKHLPEIPSAREMEQNGFDLKVMNLKLLQKIEELTLHLIEQKKELEEMKVKVGELTK